MGIFAKGRSFPATVVPDTPQTRYGGLTDESVAGKALGEVLTQVGATASSANTTTGELIGDIERLENRVQAAETRITNSISSLERLETRANKLASKVSKLETKVTSLVSDLESIKSLLRNSIIAVPPARVGDLPRGQVYIDMSTGNIHTKED